MKKPKYNTTAKATTALHKQMEKLGIKTNSEISLSYNRNWDEKGNYLFDGMEAYDFLTLKMYKTSMEPEKFEHMTKKGQKDWINFLLNSLV